MSRPYFNNNPQARCRYNLVSARREEEIVDDSTFPMSNEAISKLYRNPSGYGQFHSELC